MNAVNIVHALDAQINGSLLQWSNDIECTVLEKEIILHTELSILKAEYNPSQYVLEVLKNHMAEASQFIK